MEKWEKDLELKNALLDSFTDTCEMSRTFSTLPASIKASIAGQVIIPEENKIIHVLMGSKAGNVVLSKKRTLEAAAGYKGKKVAVLNFASPISPAGIGKKWGITQEECLCRESTLYACLSDDRCIKEFYGRHESMNYMYTSDMVYTPDVTVFKTYDMVPRLMKAQDWFDVDVITMAAPNMSFCSRAIRTTKDKEVLDIFIDRFTRIMNEAASVDVDVLILGAFGCGAFNNDPAVVATAAARVLEKYRYEFDTVEFAIYGNKDKSCYRMFKLILDKYLSENQ